MDRPAQESRDTNTAAVAGRRLPRKARRTTIVRTGMQHAAAQPMAIGMTTVAGAKRSGQPIVGMTRTGEVDHDAR